MQSHHVAVAVAANSMCGWLLRSKTFLIRFVHLSEADMCPACLRGFDRLHAGCWNLASFADSGQYLCDGHGDDDPHQHKRRTTAISQINSEIMQVPIRYNNKNLNLHF
jgi:hypothetical protein